jgi:hypothetical protein
MNLRQKAKKLKKENENLRKIHSPITKLPIKVQLKNYETLRIAKFMPFDEVPIEEYKHQAALEIGKFLVDNNFIEWEITSDDNPYRMKKIIGTIKVIGGNNG